MIVTLETHRIQTLDQVQAFLDRSALGARRNIRDLRTDGGITRIARESELR